MLYSYVRSWGQIPLVSSVFWAEDQKGRSIQMTQQKGGRAVVIEIMFPWFLIGIVYLCMYIEVQVFPQFFVSSKRSFSWLKRCLNNNFAKPFSTKLFFPEKSKTTQPMIQGFIFRLADVEPRQDEEVFHCPSDECEAKCTEVRGIFSTPCWVDFLRSHYCELHSSKLTWQW